MGDAGVHQVSDKSCEEDVVSGFEECPVGIAVDLGCFAGSSVASGAVGIDVTSADKALESEFFLVIVVVVVQGQIV